jgi:protein-L-isoaspartate(D-aspartate) O-methyltransferase
MLGMIREQLESRHSTFELGELDRVLVVMRDIEREKFVPRRQRRNAYLPISLDIGFCQTLSDAYIIALTVAAAHIQRHDNVLDVGTGSGYQAAILSTLSGHVQSLEIIPQLADRARKRLRHLGYHNVEVATADGYAGWPKRAPFDAIIVTAGATSVPQPLVQQLKPGGRLIMPVGATPLEEELVVVTKSETGAISKCTLGLAAFVPMTGQAQHMQRKGSSETRVRTLPYCYAVPVT